MIDYHAIQMTGSKCQGKNCACASCAMAIFFGTRGHVQMTSDDVRYASKASCVPGIHSPSGGIFISDVERVAASKGVTIDYGRAATTYYRRWTSTEIKARLGTYYGGVIQGLYSAMPWPWRATGSTFQGGHSGFAHDLREDLADSHYGKVQATVCWHDPLRKRPIRIPIGALLAYNQAAGATKGFVGWVKIPAIPGGTYAKPMTDRTRTAYATVAVHDKRTTGTASTVRVIRGKGRLVELAMYADGASYHGSKTWGALSLLGDEWVHVKRLDHVGGGT
jgi:hypothetical protein